MFFTQILTQQCDFSHNMYENHLQFLASYAVTVSSTPYDEIMHFKGEILFQKGVHVLILHQWYPKMYCESLVICAFACTGRSDYDMSNTAKQDAITVISFPFSKT